MKKVFQIVFCLLLSFSAFAQEKKDTTVKKESKVALGFLFAPNYSFSKEDPTTIDPNNDKAKIWPGKSGVFFDLKFSVNISIAKRFSIVTGTSYNHFRYSGKVDFAIPTVPPKIVHYDFIFMGISVGLQYNKQLQKKYSVYVQPGLEINKLICFNMGGVSTMLYNSSLINSGYNGFNNSRDKNGKKVEPIFPFIYFNAGMTKMISKKISLNMLLGYKHSWQPVTPIYTITLPGVVGKEHLFSSAYLGIGINYDF